VKVNAATRRKLLEIGETIRKARERAGISQASLADKVEMRRENMIRVEKGRANVTVETLVRIAEGLDLNLTVKLSRPK
jgi:UDP-N-acetylglucosamine 1-carboxyvinyltransferase